MKSVIRTTPQTSRYAAVLLAALAGQSLQAADIIKANNTDALNLSSSWTGASVPTAGDIAVWDSTVTSANSVLLGANQSWSGIKVVNPTGNVSISGNTLTLGRGGIDLSSASADLTIASNVLIAPGKQYWDVVAGRILTLSGDVRKQSATGANSFGVVEVSTTGSVFLSGTISSSGNPPGTVSGASLARIVDGQGNPFVTYGKNDWAATNASGQVIAATYTEATTALTAGVDNNVSGTLNNTAVDVASLRFNSSAFTTVNISTSGTSRTLTARGILVTENSAGGIIGGNAATSFVRPNRTSTAGSAFNIIQNSANNFEIAANISNGSSGAPTTLVKSGSGNLIISHAANGYTGGSQVFEGTLTVNGNAGSGAVTVATAGTLAGKGTIAGATTINGGLRTNTAPIDNTSRLTFTGNLVLGASSSTTFDIDGANYTGVTLSTADTLTFGGTLNFDFVNGVSIGVYDLFNFTDASTGSFAEVNVTSIGALSFNSGLWTGTFAGNAYEFSELTGDLTVSAIPEPSSFAAIAGALGLGFAASRRRRAA